MSSFANFFQMAIFRRVRIRHYTNKTNPRHCLSPNKCIVYKSLSVIYVTLSMIILFLSFPIQNLPFWSSVVVPLSFAHVDFISVHYCNIVITSAQCRSNPSPRTLPIQLHLLMVSALYFPDCFIPLYN